MESKKVLNRKSDSSYAASDFSLLTDRELTSFLRKSSGYAKGALLDVGCGNKPYYEIFSPCCSKYVGLDIAQSDKRKVDIIGSAIHLPLRKETFDTVLSTQVLEHVAEPERAIKEIQRVLKHNGILILSAPQYSRIHEAPYDYFRFTRYGLECLLENSSFSILRMKAIAGAWALIGQCILSYFACSPNASYGIFRPCKGIIKSLINYFFSWLNSRFPDEEDAIGYVLIARKV